jgi:hypothetical protein
MNDEQPRPRPTEIARELVERAQAGAAAALSSVVLPGGFKWALATAIADAIRRERVVTFKLRDAATKAAGVLAEYARTQALDAELQRLREAVEFSHADEDLQLPAFNSRLFEHAPSARIACLDISELTPGRLTFAFEDTYTGKGFSLTFDAASEVVCLAKVEEASAEQLGAMVAFALNDLRLRREKGEGK